MKSIYKTNLRLFISCLFIFFSGSLVAQNLTVRGNITDRTGETVPGVNIAVKGTALGTVSDIDGNYSLSVPAGNSVLVFSFIGYSTQEINVNNRTVINVLLQEDAVQLSEVVTIGYGTARKADLSTAISSIKLDQTMKSQPSNLSSILQGRLPGVTIQFNGGDPLSGQTYNIRGKGSRDSDGILWVVDGVPGAPYNMEDVETVTVLKDAASAAIYGASTGSGGVILITTKQAREGKMKVDVNVSRSFQNAWKLPKALNSQQLNKVWKDVTSLSTIMGLPDEKNAAIYPYGAETRTDWMDEIFRTGQLQHYAISLSGGTETLKSVASVSYDRTDGLLLNTYREQTGAKIGLDFQVAKWLKISETANFQYSNGQGGINTNSHESYIIEALMYPPSATVYEQDQNGNIVYENGQPLYGGTIPRWAKDVYGITAGYGSIRNPVASLERLRQNRPSTNVYSTSVLELKPVKQITVRSSFTAALSTGRYESFSASIPEIGRPNLQNSREVSSNWYTRWLWENTATYVNVFDKHHISALAGYTMQAINSRSSGSRVYEFTKEDPHYTILGNADDFTTSRPSESISEEHMISALARVGYSYDDRYFATASLRRDASSKLAPENNSGTFPAFSASWKISSEPFFHVPAIYLLKLRGGWGRVGDCGMVPLYSYNASLGSTNQTVYGKNLDQSPTAIFQQTIANRALVWETTEQTGFGLDITLLDNSLDVTVDYFHKLTRDLIDVLPAPSVAGIQNDPRGNVGKVLNEGWEFSANYHKTIGDVTFSVYGNASVLNSEVLNLDPRKEMNHNDQLRSTVGQPWYAYALIKTDGIFQTYEEITNYKTKDGIVIQPAARPGDLKFIDYNGDGTITANDRQYMGSYLPDLTYAFGFNAACKGFDFNLYFQGIAGVKIYNSFKQNVALFAAQGTNTTKDILNSWNYNAQSGNPRISWLDDANGNYNNASDYYLENGDYLRLKNVTLGYTLPKTLLQQAGIGTTGIRLYVNAENLLTFTKYKGFDPEVGNHGVDGGVYPVSRSITVGLNVNF
ncbi:SusC/RagA family TonB-linked outer membrane protein [Bacteroidia bacterium]|nr:SusC/RagA family TonB-linked outer membrane protein [Bacteroidia bacterium]GHT63619.1 SusC/RagA family TonB-linked outer membrane protein [Bacteroidia bacterium]